MKFLKNILLSDVIVLLFVFYAKNINQKAEERFNQVAEREIQHVVLCWLNEKGKEKVDQILEASLNLNDIKELKGLKSGPVIKSVRNIVDDSFDIGFIMTFNSVDDMNAYIDHPIHKAFVVNDLKPFADRFVVYDF